MFFCVSLILFGPLAHALIVIRAFTNMASLHLRTPTLFRLASVGTIHLGLAIFSVIAGVLLWLEKPRAVDVAKAYLVVAAVSIVGLQVALRIAGMEFDLLRIIFMRLAYTVAWYAYLVSSRRVKQTYGRR